MKSEQEFQKGKRKKKILVMLCLLILLLILGIILVLCYTKKNNKIEKKKPQEKPKEEVKEEPKKLSIYNEDSNQRPIAIMIDNNVGANNHIGLQDAYLSYEAIVEGGLTRIMVIFKDKQTSLIGPIRSARHYFLDYALESDAIYAHFGWSPYAQADITNFKISNINGLYVANAYWRDYTIYAPHNVFSNIETLSQSASQLGYSITSNNWKNLNFVTTEVDLKIKKSCESQDCQSELLTANQIIIPYSYSETRSYVYDSTRKVYLRFMNDVPHVDKQTGQQYFYKNIIIEKVSNYTLDHEGRQDLNTEGKGEGYYITNGYAMPIYWQKNSRFEKTTYTYKDGKEVEFNDGSTFIQLEPTNMIPTIS